MGLRMKTGDGISLFLCQRDENFAYSGVFSLFFLATPSLYRMTIHGIMILYSYMALSTVRDSRGLIKLMP